MFRFVLSWLLYGIGDLISRLMRLNGLAWLHSAYQWLMLTSSDVQGLGRGPWLDVVE